MDDLTIPLLLTMRRIADRAVIADVESGGIRVGDATDRLYDVRPMLDEHEHAPEAIDMAGEAIAYGIARRVLQRVDGAPAWVLRVAPATERAPTC